MLEADKKAFDYMLKLDTVRGPHSTGVLKVKNLQRDKIDVVKSLGTPWDMIKEKGEEYYGGKGPVMSGDHVVLMGHNRWATIGEVNEENAHPFVSGPIIGAHNGTLPYDERRKLNDWDKYGTDSEALYHNIETRGVKETINSIRGAWALTWYNSEEGSFNILRNPERPLYYAWKKSGKALYYASEPEFIYLATDKYDIELKEDAAPVPVNTHFKFTIGKAYDFGIQCGVSEKIEQRRFVSPVIYSSTYKPASESANVFKAGTNTSTENKTNSKPAKEGDYVEFVVGNTYTDNANKDFISAYTVNDSEQIRIYPSRNDMSTLDILKTEDALTFSSKVRKIKTFRNGAGQSHYLLIDVSKIMVQQYKNNKVPLPEVDDTMKELFDREEQILKEHDGWDRFVQSLDTEEIWNDEALSELYPVGTAPHFVNEATFLERTRHGCAWCLASPMPEEAFQCHWITETEFVCPDCMENDEVKEILNAA